ncbi:MAG TPA: NAD(P)/FAD-dependent oxidoreductase [Chitinophagaceae bacterium]|nr:NAD(P)/FAD-dependent oxidoreductase [Chitinophagaceae bacterium]
MQDDLTYDLAIVGGGLAGLALSIQIVKSGYRVVLFEKEQYPFHKVCGEYISLESWGFLQRLGVDLPSLNVTRIKRLQVSDIKGVFFEQPLPLGGFGISRYTLDHTLAQIAKQAGVIVHEQTRVNEIRFSDELFSIESTKGNFRTKVVAGSFGKKSNLDVKWKRPFVVAKKNKLNNYIGVKYHIRYDFPADLIALHNFKNGYCGISKIEDEKYCLCYLTTAGNLQSSNNDIRKMEQSILSANPHLKRIFSECEMLWKEPIVISQISFDKKNLVEEHVLMVGDAAGMITPLCGNGMSMAMHASKIAAEQISKFLKGAISRDTMEQNYAEKWNKLFANRLKAGRMLQRLFDSQWLTTLMIRLGRSLPPVIKALIKQTHGHPF